MRKFYTLLSFFYTMFISVYYYFKKFRVISPNHNLKAKVVISLTSKRARFNNLHLTIKSIIDQTINPDHLILWIDKNEKKFLKKNVESLKNYGLKICYCKNLRSYNKIIHTLKKYKDSFIITFDDDIIYGNKSVEYLINGQKKNPGKIIANRVHKIILNEKKIPEKYNKWIWNSNCKTRNKLNFQTGVYGVLYPPYSFFKDVSKEKIFKKISPSADDLWLYWMIRLNKKFVVWSGYRKKNFDNFNLDETLINENIKHHGNDEQIKKLIRYYGFPK